MMKLFFPLFLRAIGVFALIFAVIQALGNNLASMTLTLIAGLAVILALIALFNSQKKRL